MRYQNIIICCLVLILLIAPKLSAKNEKPSTNELFINESQLYPFFEKLYSLEQNHKGKINIVHIGDSHIQADFFTNYIRTELQAIFGNGGYGFTFPYTLASTNGSARVKYKTNTCWERRSEIKPTSDNASIGLSGIELSTTSNNFKIALSTDSNAEFNTVKFFYPTVQPEFNIIVPKNSNEITFPAIKYNNNGIKYHQIKTGETLSSIAKKYHTSVVKIKKVNKLKGCIIRAGKRIKIPSKQPIPSTIVKGKNIKPYSKSDSLLFVHLDNQPYCSTLKCDSTNNTLMICPNRQVRSYSVNGISIENDKSGIIYNSIGVNGSRIADYEKYPLFFKQLPFLKPDLIILSFGTNESFAKLSAEDFKTALTDFSSKIRACATNAVILVMTPPPSLLRSRRTNNYVKNYTKALANQDELLVWDLYHRMGGQRSIQPKGKFRKLMAKDHIHYCGLGYQLQGDLFITDFINAYNNFKKSK